MAELAPICPETVLKCADIYAHKVVPRHLAHWREEIAAEATVAVVALYARGVPASALMWRRAVIDATRKICGRMGRSKFQAAGVPNEYDRHADDSMPHDERAWCMARLDDAWETLTPYQRESVTCWMHGEPMPGVLPSSACRARGVAFRQLREYVGGSEVAHG